MPIVTHELRNFQHGFDLKEGEIGTTCRLGDKWSLVKPGDQLDLFECDIPQDPGSLWVNPGKDFEVRQGSHFRGCGEVLGHWKGMFRKIPKSLIDIEHEANNRTWEQLRQTMEKVYPGKFGVDETVTMMIYLRTLVK